MWPNIVKMIKHWESLCKSKRPQTKSYETLRKYHCDKIVTIRMQFFQDIAIMLKGYLERFQTDNPMVPFLEEALVDVLHTLMKIVVKPEVLDGAETSFKLTKLDLTKPENLLPCELVKLPTATKNLLRSNELSHEKKRQFKKDCKVMVVALLKKVQDRCPLKYVVARCSSCLSPHNMIQHKEKCINFFEKLVDRLYTGNWLSSKSADEAKKEYFQLVGAAQREHKDAFLGFDARKDRLDVFLGEFMDGNVKYGKCWVVCKIVFILSHGQAAVERGFSINKELLVENLQRVSLICQRLVCDYIIESGKEISEIPLSNDLLKSCRLAHSRYATALEKKRVDSTTEEKDRKRKRKLEEIAEVKEKKRALKTCICSLEEDIKTYSIAAEKKNDMSMLTKANSFRVTVDSKKETLSTIENVLLKLTEEEKQI